MAIDQIIGAVSVVQSNYNEILDKNKKLNIKLQKKEENENKLIEKTEKLKRVNKTLKYTNKELQKNANVMKENINELIKESIQQELKIKEMTKKYNEKCKENEKLQKFTKKIH